MMLCNYIDVEPGDERADAQVERVQERNQTVYQPHIDHLRKLISENRTHELLVDYDPEDEDSRYLLPLNTNEAL
jgi:hypothetical protein